MNQLEYSVNVEGLSKQYRLGEIGTGTLSHDLNRWLAKLRGKEDPYRTVGVSNDRAVAGGDYVWALKDVNFKVRQGEVLGIIGKNGAGKSTLLKLLSKITSPTSGSIKLKGRIASLLEVGTGFHPELTGLENIYLNGAILGMTKSEISKKIDDIVQFSGCAKYVDTPVKRYSSGMRVRLGFAVAAFLEPDILVVDEVLAVGDAEFRSKAIGKMKEVSQGGGRTVLFVSHNMSSIKSLCQTGIIMEQGGISFHGEASEAVDKYLMADTTMLESPIIPRDYVDRKSTGQGFFSRIDLFNSKREGTNRLFYRESFSLKLELDVLEEIRDGVIILKILNSQKHPCLFKDNLLGNSDGQIFEPGVYSVEMDIDFDLLPGDYSVEISLNHLNGNFIDSVKNLMHFSISKTALIKNQEFKWTRSNGFVSNNKEIIIKRK